MAGIAHGSLTRPRRQPAGGGGPPHRALVLIGFMGAGKSTLARGLAEQLGVSAFDSDSLLEQRFGHSIAREFELGGETSFRASEESLVCELLDEASGGDAGAGPWTSVIALGGGSVLSERVRAALAPHLKVFVELDPLLAWDRLRGMADRPLARDRDAFLALAAERQGLYEELADVFLPAPTAPAGALAPGFVRALEALAVAPLGTRMAWADAASGSYPVLVGDGLLGGAGDDRSDLAALWPLELARSRPFCVTDETVRALHGARLAGLGELGATIAIEPGERHKTLAVAELIWRAMLERAMTRADHVVALGGGVVGDLAGFCAATYQRGVPIVHIPSTLVAQVDSAYGGKTGVDLPEAKNYVGAYHQPAGVLTDPGLLATLPQGELAAGWVEVLKTALIAGGTLWERVSEDPLLVDESIVLDCVRSKLAVVAADERDGGRRQVLNLGHTVAHAIETVTGYGRYRHGEAVGVGLLAALRLSGADALREQVSELLLARGLPVAIARSEVDLQELLSATARDKKRLGGESVPFVLVSAPGEVRTGCHVSAPELRAAVGELIV